MMVVLLSVLLAIFLTAFVALAIFYLRDIRNTDSDERALIRRMAESAFLPDDYPRSHVRPIDNSDGDGGKSPLQQAINAAEEEMRRELESVMYADPTDATLPTPGTPTIAPPHPTGDMPWEPDFDRIREKGLG